MAASAIAGVASAAVGGLGASSAASAQQAISEDQLELAREQYQDQVNFLAPYRNAGTLGNQAYMYELGLGSAPTVGGTAPQISRVQTSAGSGNESTGIGGRYFKHRESDSQSRSSGYVAPTYEYQVGGQTFGTREDAQAWATANPTGGTAYGGFTETPGYDFRLNEGARTVEAGVAANQGLNSGAALKALERYGQDYATSEYDNYLNRLLGVSDRGQSAATGTVAASQNYTDVGTNALANYGNAQAAGAIGVGNAIQGGINNGLSLWAYNQQ